MSGSVTITLNKENYNPNPFWVKEGTDISITSEKYLKMLVTGNENHFDSHTLTCLMVYKAKPRSRLHNKTVFSKIPYRIF